MRKLLLIGVLSFVLIVSAVFTIVWFSRASAVKKDIETYIASFTTDNMKITYQDIKVSGFPFSMNVSIVSPHVNGHMNKFIEELGLSSFLKFDNMPEWNEEYVLNGSVNLGVNALSNKFRLEIVGDFSGKSSINGKNIAINSQSGGGSVCELQLANNNWMLGNMWNLYLFHDDKTKLAEDFRSLDCAVPAGKIVNSENKDPLLVYDSSRLFISHTPHGNSSDIRLYVKVKDMEATKSYDDIYNVYLSALSPKTTSIMPSIYGKQNTEIDISYNGAVNWLSAEARNAPVSLKINKFLLSNNAYNADTTLSLSSNLKGGVRNADFSYKTELSATESLRSLLQTQYSNIVSAIRQGSSKYAKETKAKLVNMSQEDTNKLFYSIVPDFTALGKIVSKIDADYTGSEDFKNFNANLKTLELSAKPYGVTSTGSIKRDDSNPLPVGNLSISCANCVNMLDDLANYVEHLQYAMSIFYPTNSPISDLSSDSVKSFKSFLLALAPASPENNGTLKFDIINDGKGEININGKNSIEVMNLYNTFFAQSSNQVTPQATPPAIEAAPKE